MAISIKAVLTSGTPRQLIFYYDEIDHAAEGTVLAVNSTGYAAASAAPWCGQSVSHVRFDSSCRNWQPTGLSFFFGYSAAHASNSPETFDLRFLNVSNVAAFDGMFMRCTRVTTLDLTTWTLKSGVSAGSMFNGCSALATLKISAGFNTTNITASTNMFSGCTSLPNFSSSVIDKTNCKSRKDGGYCYVMARQINVVGTPETVTIVDSSDPSITYGTATAQPLLKVGTYADTQDAVTGVITRRVGVKVLDGTENWSAPFGNSRFILAEAFAINGVDTYYNYGVGANATMQCTHFRPQEGAATTLLNGIGVYKNNAPERTQLRITETSLSDITALKAFLAAQYAAGDPVIILYPLATPTTESVAPQLRGTSVNEDDVSLDIVGEISGLTAVEDTSTHTTPTPEEPLDIRCNNGKLLPYRRLEYIDNNSTAWLDLGMSIGSSDIVTFDMAWNDTKRTPFFGAYNDGGSYASNSFVGTYQSDQYKGCFYVNSLSVIGMFTKPVNTRLTLKWNGINAMPTLNGTDIGTILPPYLDFTPSVNAYLFTRNEGGTAGAVDDITLYGFKVERSGAVIMNLIPVQRINDNVVGMYDLVSGQFLTNQGTGSFTAGPVVGWATDGTQEIIAVTGKNLFDEQWNRNTGVSTQNATWGQVVSAPSWSTSALIPVTAGQKYTVSYNTTKNSYIFYYEADGTMQQSYDPISIATKTFTVPSGAVNVRLQIGLASESAIADLRTQLEEGNTATAYEPYHYYGAFEPRALLKVGSYSDTQEAISGLLTHKVGVKVLTGTENWQYAGNNTGVWDKFDEAGTYVSGVGLCTDSTINPNSPNVIDMGENEFCLYPNGNFAFRNAITRSIPAWKTFLASRYAAGNPVIIVYALTTPTTETAETNRNLLAATGDDVTARVTQASMSPLATTVTQSVHTIPAPEQPLKIMTNNGTMAIDNQGHVITEGPNEQIYARSKNLFDETYPDVSSAIQYRSIYLGAGQYTMSTDNYPVPNAALVFFLRGEVTTGANNSTNGIYTNRPLTVNSTDGWVTVAYRNGSGVGHPEWLPSDFHFQIEKGSTATYYMPYKISLPVTPEMLLKVASYTDSQEIVGGTVKRNVGVKVLDGTENWTYSAPSGNVFAIGTAYGQVQNAALFCTHYVGSGASNPRNGEMRLGNAWFCLIRDDRFNADVTAFKAYLAAQYAAGTPVIVVYPLAAETTETVTGRNLHLMRGQNTIYAESPLASPSFTFAAKYNKHEGFRTVQHPWTPNTLEDGVLTIYQSWQPERDGRRLTFD